MKQINRMALSIQMVPGTGSRWGLLLLATLVLAGGCSRQQEDELTAGERPVAPVKEAHPSSQFVEEAQPVEVKVPEPCPFASDIKQVVLRDMVQRLESGLASPESLYFFQDEMHGNEVIEALQDLEPPIVAVAVPMVLQAGIPVERDTGRPIVLCAIEIGEWSDEQVDAVGIWLVDDETQGDDPYRVIREGGDWVVSGESGE